MITQEHEYFIRFILLLLQGGTELLRGLVKNAFQKKFSSLQHFLQSIESEVQSDEHLSSSQKEKLYPKGPQGAFIEDFDITILSHLALYYVHTHLESDDLDLVNAIRAMRNEHAHISEAKLSFREYNKIWTELVEVINTGSSKLCLEDQAKLKKITKRIASDPLDLKTVLDELRRLDQSTVFFESIQKSLDTIQQIQEETAVAVSNVHAAVGEVQATQQQMCAEFKKELMQLKDEQAKQGCTLAQIITFLGRFQLSTPEGKSDERVETVFLQAATDSITHSTLIESNQAVKEKMDKLLADIEEMGVTVDKVEHGCVIFVFRCMSITALLDLIDYFDSPRFQKRLEDIAETLEEVSGEKISIAASIDRQSLKSVIERLQKEHKKIVLFEMSCTGIDGLLHALEVFEEGKAAESLAELTKALSDAVETPVTLHTSIDMDGLKKAIQIIKEQLGEETWQQYLPKEIKSNIGDEETVSTHRETEQTSFVESLSLTQKNSIIVRTTSDLKDCWITGCGLLSTDRLLLADYDNMKLKVLDIHTHSVLYELMLEAEPYGVTLLPKDQAAVTLPNKQEILIAEAVGQISIIRNLPVKRDCWGVAFNQDRLYVVCTYPASVLILETTGVIRNEILFEKNSIINFPLYIAVSQDLTNMYISDWKHNCVASLTLQGKVTAVYKSEELKRPLGLTVLKDGSLLVCCYLDAGTIQHISADLTQGRILASNSRAQCVYYQPDNRDIYVSSCDYINVFTLKN